MWLKFIIFAGLGYLVYKALAGPGPAQSRPEVDRSRQQQRQIDDVMVQDPVCKVYFPKREGVAVKVDGQIMYFCSEECMKKYLNQK